MDVIKKMCEEKAKATYHKDKIIITLELPEAEQGHSFLNSSSLTPLLKRIALLALSEPLADEINILIEKINMGDL